MAEDELIHDGSGIVMTVQELDDNVLVVVMDTVEGRPLFESSAPIEKTSKVVEVAVEVFTDEVYGTGLPFHYPPDIEGGDYSTGADVGEDGWQ